MLEKEDLNYLKEMPYRKIKKLGSGSFGQIYLVEHMEEKTTWVSKEISLEGLEVIFN